jgi:hypothetical protein
MPGGGGKPREVDMKKMLEKQQATLFYYENGKRIEGKNKSMSGDCSGLSGDCSRLSGNCSGLSGDCSRLSGNCSGLYGNCSRLSGNCTELSGNLDYCELTPKERDKGIDIKDLVKE